MVTFEKEKDQNKVKTKPILSLNILDEEEEANMEHENLWQLLRSRLDFEEQT